jgi:acetyl-CoA acetyltransferase
MSSWVAGSASTVFQKHPERDFRDLAREAVVGALDDAGMSGDAVEAVYFGNCAMGSWGQGNIRGSVALGDLTREGVLPARVPILNVEAGCATGSAALHGAVQHVLAGGSCALAVGVEKVWIPHDMAETFKLFLGGIDLLHRDEWERFYADADAGYAPHPARIVFLDVHAMQARRHMQRYGTTVEQLAAIASKNHHNGTLNPKAQYRFEVPIEKVLADKPVVNPFTRSMCAPISDGAAAVLVVNKALNERCVRVRGIGMAGGTWRGLDDEDVTAVAGRRAYEAAGLSPEDVDVAEVHDANAFCELHATESLGFCSEGEGGVFAQSGATALDGALPVNPSGGLESKGHPLGATGLGMVDELVAQLRGEAGPRQVKARIGLAHNAGGMVGFDEAVAAVTLLGG